MQSLRRLFGKGKVFRLTKLCVVGDFRFSKLHATTKTIYILAVDLYRFESIDIYIYDFVVL